MATPTNFLFDTRLWSTLFRFLKNRFNWVQRRWRRRRIECRVNVLAAFISYKRLSRGRMRKSNSIETLRSSDFLSARGEIASDWKIPLQFSLIAPSRVFLSCFWWKSGHARLVETNAKIFEEFCFVVGCCCRRSTRQRRLIVCSAFVCSFSISKRWEFLSPCHVSMKSFSNNLN